jgi:hypothetical protein
MTSDRLLKIAAWLYIAALAALTFARVYWRSEIMNPYDVDRLLVFGLAGLLMWVAYPQAPSFVCLVMIASVCGLNFVHYAATGRTGPPLDAILGMAGALWGVALGAFFTLRLSRRLKRLPF